MTDALIWLLTIEALGLVIFPLAFLLFRRLPDRGFLLAKPLGLLLGAYALWVLSLAHILPNSQAGIIGIVAAMALLSGWVAKTRWPEIRAFLYEQRLALIAGEVVFLGLYFLWLTVASGSPAINHTEKPMDFAFLNSILQSSYFPPEDPWLAGHSISYYYFGHITMAFLTKLTAIPSNISYNLAVALVPAMVGAGAFSLVYNMVRLSGSTLKKGVLFALAAPLLLCLVGNLEGALEFVHARGWGSDGFWQWVSIKGLEANATPDQGLFPDRHLWWWQGTRVIDTVVNGASLDYTITEFPFFSFLLGDLHAHMLALPFLIIVLALGLNHFCSEKRAGPRWILSNPWEAMVIALAFGSLAFINTWDYPVFVVFFAILVLLKSQIDWGGDGRRVWGTALAIMVPILAASVVLFLPFFLSLQSQASGISPLGNHSTRPFFFFLIWGLFLVISGGFLAKILWHNFTALGRDTPHQSIVTTLTTLPFLLWAAIQALGMWLGLHFLGANGGNTFIDHAGELGTRLLKLLPAIVVIILASSLFLRGSYGVANRIPNLSLVMFGLALFLLAGVELFFVVDLFGNRMNTIFKVYYQVWLLLSIVSAYGLYYVLSHRLASEGYSEAMPRSLNGLPGRLLSRGWIVVVIVLLAASLYYPVGAAWERSRGGDGGTLDGLDFLRKQGSSGEYEAIIWLRDDAPKGRLVEAVGGDYTAYGRISSSTGLPTLLGWKGHEEQWRGSREAFAGREENVSEVYTSSDPARVAMILDDFEIRYVYVGARERNSYGVEHLAGFTSFLSPVFQQGDVVIYEVLPALQGTTIETTDAASS